MARKAKINPKAHAWLLEQIDEISELDPKAASDLVDRLEHLRDVVGDFPRAWKRGKIRNTRHVTMKPFVLTIRIKNGVTEIAAIRHGRQKEAYELSELRSSKKAGPDEVRRMTLARGIISRAKLIGSEIPGDLEQQAQYLVDVVTEEDLVAIVADLSNMDDLKEFLRKHNVYLSEPKVGW